jgi:hypothetical protein
LGGYEFKTIPNHVSQFDVIIKNNDTTNGVNDYYTVFSIYQNIPSIGFAPDSIIWNLRDSTHTALSSDALLSTAPVLADWNYNVLSIGGVYGPDLYGLTIYGTVTQAALIPEPLSCALMAMGMLFLRHQR